MSSENSKHLLKDGDFIQSLERGLAVIQAFSSEHPVLTISEAAKITGLSRPAVRRILLTLESLGYLTSKDGKFSLTARVLSLGYAYISSKNIWQTVRHHMEDLSNITKESCSISVLDGTDIVYVARVPTKRIMSIALDVGSKLPAYATSMGQILLAYLPEEKLENYFSKVNLKDYTENTITTQEKLFEKFLEIRNKGWVLCEQQLEIGLSSMAAPIRNDSGNVIAAINISLHAGTTSEKRVEELAPLLIETANKIGMEISKSPYANQW